MFGINIYLAGDWTAATSFIFFSNSRTHQTKMDSCSVNLHVFFLKNLTSGPSHPCGEHFFTLVDAVSNGGHIKTESLLGVPSVLSEDQSGIDAAVEMAKRVEIV